MPENSQLLESIYNNSLLNKVIEYLIHNQFFVLRFSQPKILVSFEDLRKAIWLTSILSESADDRHRNKAQLIASLIFLENQDNQNLARAVYVLFSRIGNLTGAKLLSGRNTNYGQLLLSLERNVHLFDPALAMELEIERFNNTIVAGNEVVTTTRFQKTIWIISAD